MSDHSFQHEPKRGSRGVVILELLLIVPVVLFLILATLEYCNRLRAYERLYDLAAASAEAAVVQCQRRHTPAAQRCLLKLQSQLMNGAASAFPGLEIVINIMEIKAPQQVLLRATAPQSQKVNVDFPSFFGHFFGSGGMVGPWPATEPEYAIAEVSCDYAPVVPFIAVIFEHGYRSNVRKHAFSIFGT